MADRPLPPGMRRTPEQRRVQLAELEVVNSLDRLQSQLNLTDLEMFEAIGNWQGTTLKFMLRAERGEPA